MSIESRIQAYEELLREEEIENKSKEDANQDDE